MGEEAREREEKDNFDVALMYNNRTNSSIFSSFMKHHLSNIGEILRYWRIFR